MELVKYSGSQEWSALYVDGKLDTVGDHYLISERLEDLLGVEVVESDAFMQGGHDRIDVAPTLELARQYEKAQELRHQRAESLREQAQALLAQADEIDR